MVDLVPWMVLLALAGLVGVGMVPTRRADAAPAAMARAAGIAAATALGAAVLAAGALVAAGSALTADVSGPYGFGIGARIDGLSAVMVVLVAFIGLIVTGYSRNYLKGDRRQGRFFKWLSLTLAAVLGLIVATNLGQLALAWIATSLCLHRLLVFFPDRPAARLAARKKAIVSRMGDVAMLAVVGLTLAVFGSVDFAVVFPAAQAMAGAEVPGAVTGIAVLLALAALIKSAQMPVHGWLTEVMETPTPVSALLHAGIINAGGFLILRLSDVVSLSGGALLLLAIVGGVTALFASLVMLTQTAVKGALAWSTIAQMGFMLLQCGLGAFGAALLHIVAHSLYKAHAFLSAGSIVDLTRATAGVGSGEPAKAWHLGAALAVAVGLTAGAGAVIGTSASGNPGAFVLGAVLVMGLAHMMVRTGGTGAFRPAAALRGLGLGAVLAVVYFALQSGTAWLASDALAAQAVPAGAPWIAAVMIAGFGAVLLLQNAVATGRTPQSLRVLYVHLLNGLYLNTLFNRLVTRAWPAIKGA